MKGIIGNGEKNSVWNHNWIPCNDSIKKPFSNIITQILLLKTYEMVITDKRWDVYKIKDILSDKNDVEDICKI